MNQSVNVNVPEVTWYVAFLDDGNRSVFDKEIATIYGYIDGSWQPIKTVPKKECLDQIIHVYDRSGNIIYREEGDSL